MRTRNFVSQRIGLGVAGFAIFYVPTAGGGGAYVTSIRLWDFS